LSCASQGEHRESCRIHRVFDWCFVKTVVVMNVEDRGLQVLSNPK